MSEKYSTRSLFLLFLLCINVAACTGQQAGSEQSSDRQALRGNPKAMQTAPDHVAGQVIVRFRKHVTDNSARKLIQGLGAEIVREFPDTHTFLIKLPPSMTTDEGVAHFSRLDETEFAEMNQIHKTEEQRQ